MHMRSIRPLAAAVVLGAFTVASAGNLTGNVKYDGKVPNLKPIDMAADPNCAKKHGTKPQANEALVLGPGNSMGNVLVYVKSGLPAGKTWPAPTTPVVMDQKGCNYTPRVMGIMVNQPFKVLNSDGLLHNVHALPKVNKQFNMAMPANRTEATEKFSKAEGVFTIKCDVHPWMNAYVGVFAHPFFAVTKPDGKFSIAGLPAGSYDIEAWHEKLGTKTGKVTVGADGSGTVDFSFSPPAGK
jgi:plastocyanin